MKINTLPCYISTFDGDSDGRFSPVLPPEKAECNLVIQTQGDNY